MSRLRRFATGLVIYDVCLPGAIGALRRDAYFNRAPSSYQSIRRVTHMAVASTANSSSEPINSALFSEINSPYRAP